MRLLICAGGTGGGVYPALAVLERLKVESSRVEKLGSSSYLQPSTLRPSSHRPDVLSGGQAFNLQLLWVGGDGGMEEELVNRAEIPYTSIPAAGVHGVGLRALPGNIAKLTRGVVAARRILKDFSPDVLFFTGGYVAAPMAVAGRDIPTLLFVPDIEPGLALKFLARYADRVAVSVPDSNEYFPHPERLVITGYPLRADLMAWYREKATQYFDIDPDERVVLVTGGSKGARSINIAVLRNLDELLGMAHIIHITGSLDWQVVEETAAQLPQQLKNRYHIFPYLHEMGAALSISELVISRAGASTLGEYPFFGLPAILVPYPYAWRYQKVNADYLAEHGAAVILQDELLTDRLLVLVKDLLENPNKREAMRAAMQSLSRPNAADAIASQLLELAGEQPL